MVRTKRGECTRPYKKQGRKPLEQEPQTHKQKDRHKRRKAKQQVLGNGKDFVGDIPSFLELNNVFIDETAAVRYMEEVGMIDVPKECPRCGNPKLEGRLKEEEQCKECGTKKAPDFKRHRVRCRKQACKFTPPVKCEWCEGTMDPLLPEEDPDSTRHCSNRDGCGWSWDPGQSYSCCYFKGSLTYESHLPKNEILYCLWLWLHRIPCKKAASMLKWDHNTVGRRYRHLRLIVVEMLLTRGHYESQVGGEGIIVEIDESKFGKRKYNRGRKVNGSWVLGMVERTPERRMALIVVPDRSRDTLEPILEHFIAPGSTIHSDMWKAYDKLEEIPEKNYKLERLCHKYEFVSETGIHTQTIESNWCAVKRHVPLSMRNGNDLQEFLFEFMWRRQNEKNLWNALMEGLSRIRYTSEELLAHQEGRNIACEDDDDDWELPRNCRPRDFRMQVDFDSDGSAERRDTEVVAAAALSSLVAANAAAAPSGDGERGVL